MLYLHCDSSESLNAMKHRIEICLAFIGAEKNISLASTLIFLSILSFKVLLVVAIEKFIIT